jgi:uncharacterized protein (TIGR02145 family)
MKNLIILFSFIFAVTSHLIAQTIMNIHQNNGTVLQIPISTIDSITYTNPGNLVTITTSAISNITNVSVLSGGNVSSNGGSLVTQRGVCWSTSPNPTTANYTTNDGSGTGSFTSSLTGLIASTTYYVRAYAINSAGTAYGNQVSFTTSSGGGTGIVSNPGLGVTFNGYTYPTFILGNGQEWMAENLRTTVYANGDLISNITVNTQWRNLSTGAWVYNNNDSQNNNPYGKLYNWYAVADSRNLCPTGWHVPTDSDWSAFVNYLDPNADGGNVYPNIAGDKMKSIGYQYWPFSNSGATNESRFSGLPGGSRDLLGAFGGLGFSGQWWSSTEDFFTPDYAIVRILQHIHGSVSTNTISKQYGLSVRCLKD